MTIQQSNPNESAVRSFENGRKIVYRTIVERLDGSHIELAVKHRRMMRARKNAERLLRSKVSCRIATISIVGIDEFGRRAIETGFINTKKFRSVDHTIRNKTIQVAMNGQSDQDAVLSNLQKI